jgi:phosphoribosylanthranilate isomerase
MIVQIYEVGSAAEAAALVALGVDHVGVLVGEGSFPRELPAARVLEILAAVRPPAKRVALSLSGDIEEIARIADAIRPDILHLGAAPELLPVAAVQALKARLPGLPVMRSIPVVDRGSIALGRAYGGVADFLLLDSRRAGDSQVGAQGRTHDWALSREIVMSVAVPAILAGGLGPANVAAAIAAVGPAGVDSKTLTDRADGEGKDLAKVRDFVAAARAAADALL